MQTGEKKKWPSARLQRDQGSTGVLDKWNQQRIKPGHPPI
jgi:hypothetical protein